MTLLVDTSVWSLAFRRDATKPSSEVNALKAALAGGDSVVTTGLVLQELLQGFSGPRDRTQIIERFGALPLCPLTGKTTSRLPSYGTDVGVQESRWAPSMRSWHSFAFGMT